MNKSHRDSPPRCCAPVACCRSVAAEHIALGDKDMRPTTSRGAGHYQAAIKPIRTMRRARQGGVRRRRPRRVRSERTAARHAVSRTPKQYARRAVAANPNDAEGHFQLARAIGRNALTMGKRDQVKYAGEVRDEALTALEVEPQARRRAARDGRVEREVMRLNGLSRMIAKNFARRQSVRRSELGERAEVPGGGRGARAEPHHAPPRSRRGLRRSRHEGQGDRAVRVDRASAGRRTSTTRSTRRKRRAG